MKILRAAALAAASSLAAVLAFTVPAMASVPHYGPSVHTPPAHTPFVVIVDNGVDVTLEHLTAGQEVYKGGAAEHVVTVNGHEVRFSPPVTGPDGTKYQFST